MKKIYSILFAAVILVAAGCKKQLDLKPTDTFNQFNAFQSMQDLQDGLNAAYKYYGNAYLNNMYANALTSDEGKLGTQSGNTGATANHWQYTSSDGIVTGAFGSYYNMIDQVNRVLAYVETVPATTSEEPRRDIIKGQLLGLRALGHFELLQAYSNNYDPADPLGVPVMTVSNPTGIPPRNSMGEVMAQINTDITEAKALLASQPFTDTVLNPVNLTGYQARIALYTRDYQAAIDYATEVIVSDVKPLASGGVFAGIWTDANQEELLFRVKFTSRLGTIFTSTTGGVSVAPTNELVASYEPADIRLSSYIGTTSSGEKYVNKFYESASRGPRIVDLKALRTAEMYLIRAEAYAKLATPNVTAGAEDLNTLRAARINGYVPENFTTAQSLLIAVIQERFKELAFEGFRFFDLKRNNLPVERLASDSAPDWQTLPAGNFRFVYPIPLHEIQANPNMTQNPNY